MWVYKDKEVKSHEDLHTDCTDIVYCIYYDNGKRYIGKKNVRGLRKLKPTKAQLKIRKNYKRVELVEVPFVKYEGSSKNTLGLKILKKEIVYQCSNKTSSTYLEAATLFNVDAIFSEEYLNENISGKFYDNALDGYIKDDD